MQSLTFQEQVGVARAPGGCLAGGPCVHEHFRGQQFGARVDWGAVALGLHLLSWGTAVGAAVQGAMSGPGSGAPSSGRGGLCMSDSRGPEICSAPCSRKQSCVLEAEAVWTALSDVLAPEAKPHLRVQSRGQAWAALRAPSLASSLWRSLRASVVGPLQAASGPHGCHIATPSRFRVFWAVLGLPAPGAGRGNGPGAGAGEEAGRL